jgi:amino acid transporter
MNIIRHFFIGSPIPTQEQKDLRLNKIRALAAFSPDALSSIAYANQEIFLALVVAGSSGLALSFPIGLAITGLLVLVALSYYQTIQGYPSGGGSYIVARENLGTFAGLAAAAALLVDYVLTAAVSLTSGVAAIASSFPFLWEYQTIIALLFLCLITLLNLRGIKETGSFMAIPVYFFLFTYLVMLMIGFIKGIIEGPGSLLITAPDAQKPLSNMLVLQAFSAGCTALTGVEAISNGVPVFKKPEVKNASQTMLVMALLMSILFIGSLGLTQYFAITTDSSQTILSALTHRVLGNGFAYILVQISSTLILVVAANTSFAGFPRLAAILAKDNFLPHQFTQLGDRLVYNNGIILLSAATGILIVIFRGDSHALVPLFAVGVFLAFTLSQAGMVIHWWRSQGKGWITKLLINGFGAIATFFALLIISISKFTNGAWISILIIPIIMLIFLKIRSHYETISSQLSLHKKPVKFSGNTQILRVVIPISGVHQGVLEAVRVARCITKQIKVIYIEIDPDISKDVQEKWDKWIPDIQLNIIASPYRSIISPLLDYLDEYDKESDDGQLATLILPEIIPVKWWHHLLHNQTARLIRTTLIYRRQKFGYQRVIIDVPYHLSR